MRIFLMGFMASGKTSVGKKLASHLDIPFVDLDQFIEANEGRSVTQIFEQDGEKAFRALESKNLEACINETVNGVIALGGGTPCDKVNLEQIRQSGISVYLELNEREIFSRLKQNRGGRPLINNLSDAELEEFIIKTLNDRRPYYTQADICFPARDIKGKGFSTLLQKIGQVNTT